MCLGFLARPLFSVRALKKERRKSKGNTKKTETPERASRKERWNNRGRRRRGKHRSRKDEEGRAGGRGGSIEREEQREAIGVGSTRRTCRGGEFIQERGKNKGWPEEEEAPGGPDDVSDTHQKVATHRAVHISEQTLCVTDSNYGR